MSQGIGYEMWGFAASIVGTIFCVPFLYAWLTGGLPSAKMEQLETLLSETEGLLRTALQEGTIEYDYYERKFESWMWQIKMQADAARADVYNIKSSWQEFRCWLTGMSGIISAVIEELSEIRGGIALSSNGGRQRLAKMGCIANPTLVIYSKEPMTHILLPVAPPNAASMAQSHAAAGINPNPGYIASASFPEHTQLVTTHGRALHVAAMHSAAVHTGTHKPPCIARPPQYRESTPIQKTGERRATKSSIFDFGRKLVHPIRVRGTSPIHISALKQQNMYTSRLGALTGIFNGLPTTLPRHWSPVGLPAHVVPERTGEKETDWMETGHVIAQVQLTV
ncbi:hypothetical protein C8Q80DRAFT_1151572 [Daedaleopsis nitida]|nr:hypothetical protein C8Q80DRAFT_1151572 [Daedaleopsis nitida]